MSPMLETRSGTLRDAREADLAQIVRIYNAAIPSRMSVADTLPVTVESRADWFLQHDSSRRPIWVLERASTILGWISLQSFAHSAAFNGTAEVSVYVSDSSQRSGIGTLLLGTLIKFCPTFGVETVLGFTFAHNEPVIRLNRRIGLAEWGRLRNVARLDGMTSDMLIFGLNIAQFPALEN